MEIYINSERLDIYSGQDIELNWENIRFSEAIADEWTTDIELPNNENNIRILKAYGLLDRGPLFNSQIPCQLIINDVPRDGYLHVTTITRDTITVACFLSNVPYALWDKQLKDYYPKDNSSSIYRWDRSTPIANNIIDDICFLKYMYGDRYYSNIVAQYHPSVRAEYINQIIQTEENITLPTLRNDLYTMASGKYLCPQNTLQVFSSYMKGQAATVAGVDIPLVGGQHITNDFKTEWSYVDTGWLQDWSDLNGLTTFKKWLDHRHQNVIKFNRSGKFTAKVYACCDRSTTITIRLYKNGVDVTNDYHSPLTTPVYQLSATPTDVTQLLSFAVYNVPYVEGDEFSFRYQYVSAGAIAGDNVYATIIMEHSGYEITDDDYSVDLGYIAAPYGFGFAYHTTGDEGEGWMTNGYGGDGKGPNPLNYTYCYYGVWTNMPSCSVRDWLTGMCWVHGRKTKLDGFDLTFTTADQSKVIDGYISEITTYSDKLGQRNVIKYRDDYIPVWFKIDNNFLESEVDLFEAPFGTSIYLNGIAEVDQYKFEDEMTEENSQGQSWVKDIKVDFNDIDLCLFTAVQTGNTYQLERAPFMTKFSIDTLNTMCAKIETYTMDVLNCDWVYLNGRKFLVTNGTFNVNTGKYELDTIEVTTRFSGECSSPIVNCSFTPAGTDCVVTYQAFDSTGTGTLTMYVYSDLAMTTLVGTYNMQFSTSGSQTISGLTENTTYYVKVEAINECGEDTKTYSFQTIYNVPQLSVVVSNVTSVGADITYTYTGNYPIDTSNYTDIRAFWGPSGHVTNIEQFGTLANGHPETIHHTSGLTPNTTYYVEFYVDYYGDEIGLPNPGYVTFTTLPAGPIVSISSITDVTSSSCNVNISITE